MHNGQYWPEVHHGGSAERCIPERNCLLIPFLLSAGAADPAIIVDFGLEVERRSTLRANTHGECDTSDQNIDKLLMPVDDVFLEQFDA